MTESNDCVFCKIVRGELPHTLVYSDEHTLAFLSINPDAPDHTLIIPRKHVRNILDCPPDVLNHVMATVQKISKQLAAKYGGVKIIQNNEKPFQEVFHLHFHVIPNA